MARRPLGHRQLACSRERTGLLVRLRGARLHRAWTIDKSLPGRRGEGTAAIIHATVARAQRPRLLHLPDKRLLVRDLQRVVPGLPRPLTLEAASVAWSATPSKHRYTVRY